MTHVLILARSLLGAGIRSTLDQTTDWQVQLASTWDPEEVEVLVQNAPPDVTILDDTAGHVLELLEQLGRQRVGHLGMTMVVTAVYQSEETLFHLAKWGTAAYLSADTPLEDFVSTVRRVRAGEWLLSSEGLRKKPLQAPRSRRQHTYGEPGMDDCVSPLTARETAILTHLAQGKSNKEIARMFVISDQTVKNHMASCYKKLGVSDRTAAVVSAFRRGWIQLPACSISSQATFASVA